MRRGRSKARWFKWIRIGLSVILFGSALVPLVRAEETTKSKVVNFAESSSSANRTQTVTIPNLNQVQSVTVSPDNATLSYTRTGNQLAISVGGGSYTRSEHDPSTDSIAATGYTTSLINAFSSTYPYSDANGYSGALPTLGSSYVESGTYNTSDSRTQTSNLTSSSNSCPSSMSYNNNGYSGTLTASGSSYVYSGSYTPSESRTFSANQMFKQTSIYNSSGQLIGYYESPPLPASFSINSDGYVGSIPKISVSITDSGLNCNGSTCTQEKIHMAYYSGTIFKQQVVDTRVYRQDYSGTVSRDTRVWRQDYAGTAYKGETRYFYSYVVTVNYSESLTTTLTAPVEGIKYSNAAGYNTISVAGTTKDTTVGNTLSVKYQFDNGAPTVLKTLTSNGADQNFGPSDIAIPASLSEGTHTLKVWTADQNSNASFGETRTFTIDRTPAGIPGTLTSPVQSGTTVLLSWLPPSNTADLLQYNVYRDGTLVTSTKNTSYTVTGLTQGATYAFTVRSVDTVGNVSAAGNTLNQRTSPILAPTGLRATSSTASSITLGWSPSTSMEGTITGYEIYNGSTLVGTSTSTSYQALNLTADLAYTFSVKAIDSAGNKSAASVAATVYTRVDAYEPNDATANALPINYAFRYLSNISSGTDVDYYKFTATANVNHLTLNVPASKNYDVTIYDSSMNVVAQGINPANQWEEVTFSVTPGNVYYIKVAGVSGQYSAATYQLYLTQVVQRYVYNASGQLIQTYAQKGLYRYQTDIVYDLNGNMIKKIASKQIFGFRDKDISPATGSIASLGYNGVLGMDNSNRSVGVDLGSVRGIAKLEMIDSDNATRITEGDYLIFKSNDNVTYTPVTDWSFSSSVVNNRKVHTFSFNGLNARYLKISTIFTDASSTFLMYIQQDMKVYLNQ